MKIYNVQIVLHTVFCESGMKMKMILELNAQFAAFLSAGVAFVTFHQCWRTGQATIGQTVLTL